MKKKKNYTFEILDLMTDEWLNTSQVYKLGKSKGYFSRRGSYDKPLNELYSRGLIERKTKEMNLGTMKFWRKKQ